MLVYGGIDNSGEYLSDIWSYNLGIFFVCLF